MAKTVITSPVLTIAGTDVTTYCSKVEFTRSADENDGTTFGSAGKKEFVPGGLESGEIAFDWIMDPALDTLMWPLFNTLVAWTAKATTAANSATNPLYSGTFLLKEWTPISGEPGSTQTPSTTFPTSGAITRATS